MNAGTGERNEHHLPRKIAGRMPHCLVGGGDAATGGVIVNAEVHALAAALPRIDQRTQRHVLQKLRHDKGLKLRCDCAGFQFGELEQSVDQPSELIRLPQSDAQVRTQVALHRRDVLDERGLDVAAQGGQRRAQVVRDVRNEFPPQLIRCLEVADLMFNRL